MRVKSRKPPAEIFDHFALGDGREIVGGADDVVGDQMRHMAGDREHQIVMLGVHHLDLAAEALPELPSASRRAAGSAPGGGVRMHQRPSNNSAKPASGPDCSVPAIGWAGMKCTPLRNMRADIAHHRRLDRADIADDRARLQMRRHLLRELAESADRRREHDEIGVAHAVGDVVVQRIGEADCRARASASRRGAHSPRCGRRAVARRMAWAIDEPIRPMPISATLSNSGFASRHLRAMKSAQRRDDRAVGVFGADRQAQAMRQAVGARRRAGSAARGRESVGVRGVASSSAKWISTKLPTLSSTRRPSVRMFSISQARHLLVVRDGGFDMGAILQRRRRRALRRRRDVERPADAVEHVGDCGRAIGPADAQACKAIDLREGPRHHDIVDNSRPARCRPRNRCAAHIRHRPRRSRAGCRAASPACRRRTSSCGR